jgi:hypothetical protein
MSCLRWILGLMYSANSKLESLKLTQFTHSKLSQCHRGAIVDYVFRSQTNKNKLSFSVSVCSKPTEVWPFPFFVCSKRTEIAISVSSVFRIYKSIFHFPYICMYSIFHLYVFHFPYTSIYTYMLPFQIEYGTYIYIYTENGSPGDFPLSVYRLLIVQTEVCRLSFCWRRNKRKLSVFKLAFPSMPVSKTLASSPKYNDDISLQI